MSERITTAEVIHVARLARLGLTDEEIERTTAQLGDMLDHFADIDGLDLDDVVPMTQPYPLINVLRGRRPAGPRSRRGAGRRPGPRRRALRGAPDHRARRVTAALTASEIAAAVRAGDRRAADVVDEHLANIAAREQEIHAFNLVLADEARSAAAAVDAAVADGRDPGPLAGVPVALKDNMVTRGIPTTCSSRILEGWRPPYDATVVERLRPPGP